ncbi:MAG: hypothetical protein HQL67_04760 [Magnetococcales bacterium]|nr:hypothetical protein [Magnetococcales bacterium]
MTIDTEAFDDCPAGKEVDGFHERILAGLLDAFSELNDSQQKIQSRPLQNRTADDREFLNLYQQVEAGFVQLRDEQLSYDQKYELAQVIQAQLLDLSLLN